MTPVLALSALLAATPATSPQPERPFETQPQGLATAFAAYVSSGLTNPIGIMHAGDGSGRVFIIQQGGAARVVVDGTLQGTAFFTLDSSTQCRATPASALSTVGFTSGGERGLLGLAFHPDFASNGRVFASFTDTNGDSYVARFTMANPAANSLSAADLQTCVAVLRVDQDFSNHNGGGIAFGPDGYLYFGLGDGGSGGDPCRRGQTISPAQLPANDGNNAGCPADAAFTGSGGNPDSRALLGAMLRLDVDASTPAGANGLCAAAADGSANYAIPSDNPYVGADPAGACDEIWAWGLRNPWRWSFDRDNGDLFIGDVGQGAVEEVSFEPASSEGGLNFGWNLCEGNSNHFGTGCATPGLTAPIITYARSGGRCSITGGYRYCGPVADARGLYFFADYCSRQVWTSSFNGSSWTQPVGGPVFQTMANAVTSFGEDEAGNLYITNGSQIWRLQGLESQPPVLVTPIGDQLSAEGDTISLDVSGNFADPDGGSLPYLATGLPPGLSISPAGLISGELGYSAAGTYSITVQPGDACSGAVDSFTWQVANTNRPPQQDAPLPNRNSVEGEVVGVDLAPFFSDPDGDQLEFSASGLPDGLGLSLAGMLSGTLSYASAGSHPVLLTVSDGEDEVQAGFTWTVANVNRPPVQAEPLPARQDLEFDAIDIDLAPWFSDPDGDELAFSATGLPPGVTLSPAGRLQGVLAEGSLGEYAVEITVDDGEDAIVAGFDWSVRERPAPIFDDGFEDP
jgi:glucose/arabinose dehydrogenase